LGRVTSLDGWNHTYSCDGLLLSSEPSAPAEGSRRSALALHVEDNECAAAVLNQNGFNILGQSDISR
jgi:hypothetical protein